jgi:hypothetical protein
VSPDEKILELLAGRALPVRTIVGLLLNDGYQWPVTSNRGPNPAPNSARVYGALNRLERDGKVVRLQGEPARWKVAT